MSAQAGRRRRAPRARKGECAWPRVPRAVDLAHPARAGRRQELVEVEAGARLHFSGLRDRSTVSLTPRTKLAICRESKTLPAKGEFAGYGRALGPPEEIPAGRCRRGIDPHVRVREGHASGRLMAPDCSHHGTFTMSRTRSHRRPDRGIPATGDLIPAYIDPVFCCGDSS